MGDRGEKCNEMGMNNGGFRPVSRCISKTVQDTTTVTIIG